MEERLRQQFFRLQKIVQFGEELRQKLPVFRRRGFRLRREEQFFVFLLPFVDADGVLHAPLRERMDPFEIRDAALLGHFQPAADIRPVEHVFLPLALHAEQLRRQLDAVQRWRERRHIQRVQAMRHIVFDVFFADRPELLRKRLYLILGDQRIRIEPVGDMEVFARSQLDIMQDRLERHFLLFVAFRLDRDDDRIRSRHDLRRGLHGNPEAVRLVLRQDNACLVEQRIRNEARQAVAQIDFQRKFLGGNVFRTCIRMTNRNIANPADTDVPSFRPNRGYRHFLRAAILTQKHLEAHAFIQHIIHRQRLLRFRRAFREIPFACVGQPNFQCHFESPFTMLQYHRLLC